MKLYAVMFVWNEADIIEATVRNAFAQGADKVFLIDNGSMDSTIETALKAGAILAREVDNGYFDGQLKYGTVNEVIREVNARENDSSIWWMILDADEFPDTRLGLSVRQFIESCDNGVNVLAADLIDHVPTHPPYNIPGFHPIFFQPMEGRLSMKKLPLIRYDRGGAHITTMAGAHTYQTEDGGYLTGSPHRLVFHHFNYRRPETSLRRLKLLTALRPDGTRRIDERDDYARRMAGNGARTVYWDRLEGLLGLFADMRNKHLFAFQEERRHIPLPLWHGLDEVGADLFESPEEHLFWRASALLYAERYEEALCAFNELSEDEGFLGRASSVGAVFKGMELCFRRTGDTEGAELAARLIA